MQIEFVKIPQFQALGILAVGKGLGGKITNYSSEHDRFKVSMIELDWGLILLVAVKADIFLASRHADGFFECVLPINEDDGETPSGCLDQVCGAFDDVVIPHPQAA